MKTTQLVKLDFKVKYVKTFQTVSKLDYIRNISIAGSNIQET